MGHTGAVKDSQQNIVVIVDGGRDPAPAPLPTLRIQSELLCTDRITPHTSCRSVALL